MWLEHWGYTIPLRLRSVFRRRRVEQELEDELRFHLEREIRERIAQGADPREARRQAPGFSNRESYSRGRTHRTIGGICMYRAREILLTTKTVPACCRWRRATGSAC